MFQYQKNYSQQNLSLTIILTSFHQTGAWGHSPLYPSNRPGFIFWELRSIERCGGPRSIRVAQQRSQVTFFPLLNIIEYY